MPPRVMLEGVYVQRAWGGEYGGINQPGATIRGCLAVTPGERLNVEACQNGSYAGKATFGGGGPDGLPPPVVSRAGADTRVPAAPATFVRGKS